MAEERAAKATGPEAGDAALPVEAAAGCFARCKGALFYLVLAAVLAAAGIGSVLPWVQEQLAARALTDAGFMWNEKKAAVTAGGNQAKEVMSLDAIAPALHRLQPRSLDLGGCDQLTSVDGLQGLTALESLDLSSCIRLKNVDALRGLTSLQSLDLFFCAGLENVDGLAGLTALETLDMSICPEVKDVEVLRGLTALRNLDLSECRSLTNVDALRNLHGLRGLTLSYCRALTNVDGLAGLPDLKSLDLSHCAAFTGVEGLRELRSLQSLWLNGCKGIPRESWEGLGAALPRTWIMLPDGAKMGPK